MAERYDRRFEGVWIPRNIWLSETLTLQEKAFLVEIKSLDNEHGCFASNEHFSKFFQLSKSRCSEVINKLKDKNLIALELMYIPGTKQVEKRIIRVNYGHEIFLERGIRNLEGGIREVEGGIRNPEAPPSEKAEDNNTVFNNTSNNTRDIDRQSSVSLINPNFEPIKQLFESKVRVATLADCNNIHEALEFYEPQLIKEAISVGSNSARSFKYILSILDNWRKELGVETYADWQVKIDAKNGRQNGSSNGGAKGEKPTVFGNFCSD
ncbi:helix-turn-helix domain-containing protein [Lysinibacillus sp. NPDC093712]|uniref:helix-turn-helix domain-containing protein n=1 Tax=Lysinibacillus sp. NPDC093712 TaxID=3390579 RepID=UPI003D0907BF